MSFVMGLLVFFPGTFQDYAMAVPFMPVSVVLFGVALVTKLYFDADDNRNAFRAVTILVFLGTALWITGTIFVTETPLALTTLPAGVSSSSGFWYTVYNTFSSEANVNLAMTTFDITFAALGVIGLFGFAHPILHSRIGKQTPKITHAQGPASRPASGVSTLKAAAPCAPTGRARCRLSASFGASPGGRCRVHTIGERDDGALQVRRR